MTRAFLPALLLASALAGCFTTAPPEVSFGVASFEAVDHTGRPFEVRAHAWRAAEPTDVAVLLLHGIGGSKDEFAPLSISGYSLGEYLAARGFDTFAVDMPGQNASRSESPETLDHGADVVANIAAAIRKGSYAYGADGPRRHATVIGLGHSLGAIVILHTQAKHAAFDAIIPSSWSVDGLSQEMANCVIEGAAGAPRTICAYDENAFAFVENMDPVVLAELPEVYARGGGTPAAVTATAALWHGPVVPGASQSRPSLIAEDAKAIRAPVLVVAGKEDVFFEKDAFDDEALRYPNAKTIEVRLYARTGHVVFHHLDRETVYAEVAEWIAGIVEKADA